jgi:bifunctional UDP-N-acetylglucosamine pyrophosphorylase/glucosamine-1-phosphate N-acetyltransferase
MTTRLHWHLFSLENLPEDLAKLIRGSSDPVDLLNRLPAFLKSKIKGQQILGEVEEGAVIHGDVYIGKGTIIHSGVVIEGPVYIGDNVSVRPHANVRHGAYLADNCVIGHSADVKNTLALPGCKIQDGTFAGDSILGHAVRVGSGALLANRKFNQGNIRVNFGEKSEDTGRDFFGAIIGDQSRLGANVVTSPGTVIGTHTWVGSGVVLSGYVGPDQLITVKQELEIRSKDRTDLKAGKAITFDFL